MTLRPSAEWITLGAPPSITATHELVVPRSMPIIFAITSKIQSSKLKIQNNFPNSNPLNPKRF
jgi:hypothetical protein